MRVPCLSIPPPECDTTRYPAFLSVFSSFLLSTKPGRAQLSRRKIAIKKELEYFREHHIRIKILDIPPTMVELPDEQDWIFEMINNILIEVLASIAEQERITTKRRQSEGIAIAKEAGKHLGRPMIDFPPNWNQFYSDWKAGTITAVAAMRQLGLKRSTFYRLVKQQEEKHETEK